MGDRLVKYFLPLSLVLVILRIFFISSTTLIDDEAYYAIYARHLDWGYIDHGPIIAYLVWIFTYFGENDFTIRIGAVVLMASLALILYRFGRTHFNKNAGIVMSLGVSVNMLFHTNAVVMTPDVPLAFFCILSIMYYYKAFCVDTKHLYSAGVLLGLAMLSKVSAVFPALGIFLFPFLVKEKRYLLKNIHFYGSFAVAFLVFLPFIIWNLQHDLAFFRYQGDHATRPGNMEDFVAVWLSLLFTMGPIYFYFSVLRPFIHLGRWQNLTAPLQYFTVITAIPLVYFLVHSFLNRLELNWPAPVFFGGLFLFGINNIDERWKTRKSQFALQIIYSLVLIMMVTVQTFKPFLPIEVKADITQRYYRYNSLLTELPKFLDEHSEFQQIRIVANNYQVPSIVNVYLNPDLEATCLSIGYHQTLYSFLHSQQWLKGEDLLFIASKSTFPEKVRPYFDEITFFKQIDLYRNGKVIGLNTLWLAENYKGY